MDHKASSRGRLFLAATPDADTAARIFRLATVLKRAHRFDGELIAPQRLHVSLFFLGVPEDIVRMAYEAAAEIPVSPFEISFDRYASFRGKPGSHPLVLVGDEGLEQLRSFRRTLGIAMAKSGLKHFAKKDFVPHVTLVYADRGVEEHPIEPIRWTVNEIVLIHSLRGHIHLGRWSLCEG
jgi:2'-5' RNA ligase